MMSEMLITIQQIIEMKLKIAFPVVAFIALRRFPRRWLQNGLMKTVKVLGKRHYVLSAESIALLEINLVIK